MNLRNNQIQDINLEGLVNLKTLDIENNELQSIDLKSQLHLKKLYISRNPLTETCSEYLKNLNIRCFNFK